MAGPVESGGGSGGWWALQLFPTMGNFGAVVATEVSRRNAKAKSRAGFHMHI